MAKEKIVQLQMALFFKGIENRPDRLVGKIDDVMGGLFDQMPTIIPIPSDAPAEFPSVIMRSSNGVYVCNISKTRIDLVVNLAQSSESFSVNIEKFLNQVKNFSRVILEMKEITRFGFVGTYFIQKTNPISEIQTKFIKNEKQKQNLEELSIRYNSRSSYENLTINDVVEISKGEINGTQEGIVIRRDFNNIPVNSLELSLLLSTIEAHKSKFVQSGIMELI